MYAQATFERLRADQRTGIDPVARPTERARRRRKASEELAREKRVRMAR
jgi:hypothetical protein